MLLLRSSTRQQQTAKFGRDGPTHFTLLATWQTEASNYSPSNRSTCDDHILCPAIPELVRYRPTRAQIRNA